MEIRDLMQHHNPKIKKRWIKAVSNEYGRLMKGIGKKREGKSRVEGHDTIRPIHMNQVPENKTVTYARFCCDHRPQKEEQD